MLFELNPTDIFLQHLEDYTQPEQQANATYWPSSDTHDGDPDPPP